MSTQHVIYRCTPAESPKWTFYSTPVSVLGGADTLADAKVAAREALAFALDCPSDELPAIVEHTERELVANVWVRAALDQHRVDRQEAFEILGKVLKAHPDVVDTLATQPAASGDAIIVACRGDDLIASVLEQMTSYDAVWIALRLSNAFVWWTPLAGKEAEGVDVQNDGTLDQLGLGPGSTVFDLYQHLTAGPGATEVDSRKRVGPRVLV